MNPNSKRYWFFTFYWARFLFGYRMAKLDYRDGHVTVSHSFSIAFWQIETLRHYVDWSQVEAPVGTKEPIGTRWQRRVKEVQEKIKQS